MVLATRRKIFHFLFNKPHKMIINSSGSKIVEQKLNTNVGHDGNKNIYNKRQSKLPHCLHHRIYRNRKHWGGKKLYVYIEREEKSAH